MLRFFHDNDQSWNSTPLGNKLMFKHNNTACTYKKRLKIPDGNQKP